MTRRALLLASAAVPLTAISITATFDGQYALTPYRFEIARRRDGL